MIRLNYQGTCTIFLTLRGLIVTIGAGAAAGW
mgnify:FL=1